MFKRFYLLLVRYIFSATLLLLVYTSNVQTEEHIWTVILIIPHFKCKLSPQNKKCVWKATSFMVILVTTEADAIIPLHKPN